MPMTESWGPVMPTSVMYAVPSGRIRSSAVWTWVWVPNTALTLPLRNQPMATFSEVASAWKSTKMMGVRRCSSDNTASTPRNGQSMGGMNTRPCRLITATGMPICESTTVNPRPGTPGG